MACVDKTKYTMSIEVKVGDPSLEADKDGKYANRAAHIAIDKKRIRKYDLRRKRMIHLLIRLTSLTVAFAAVALWLILMLKWWTILLGVVSLCGAWFCGQMIIYPIRGLKALYELYHDSSLIGSVVISENPLTVAALINLDCKGVEAYRYYDGHGNEISSEEYDKECERAQQEWDEKWADLYEEADYPEDEKIWESFWNRPENNFHEEEDEDATNLITPFGCRICRVGDGDWSYKVGDRLPCSSAYGDSDPERGIWTEVDVIPLVWGSKNSEDLKACVNAISDYEWRLLEEMAPHAKNLEQGQLFVVNRNEQAFSFTPVEG